MQNKGFVLTFAIALALVCAYYLSFSVVTYNYNNKAKDFATNYAKNNSSGDQKLYQELYNKQYNHYLDSLSTEKVYFAFGSNPVTKTPKYGFTLKQCRDYAIGLGLDLEGGMSVIVEVDVPAFLETLGDVNNKNFIEAVNITAKKSKIDGSNKDFLSLFYEEFKSKAGEGKLAGVFSTKLNGQITPTDNDKKVLAVLKEELQSVADNAFNVLRTRIDRFGVVSPNIQKLDNRAEQIIIELPGIKEPERVRKLLQGNANLQFWRTYTASQVSGDLGEMDNMTLNALSRVDSLAVDTTKLQDQINLGYNKSFFNYFFVNANPNSQIRPSSQATVGIVNKNDTAAVNAIIADYNKIHKNSNLNLVWGIKEQSEDRKTYLELYSLQKVGRNRGPVLDGDVVTNAKADIQGGGWAVSMNMNNEGSRRWAEITEDAKGTAIAIVLDGYVYSAPNVQNKIEGGVSSITGNFSRSEAGDLENVLKSGKMKVGVHIVKEDVVGPSLGQEAIDAGIISFIVALVLLMLYMCLIYGLVPGLVANAALVVNLFFTLGTLAALGAVFTLPGITGLILSLALAVDANVLIYERTKEELRAGKNIKQAIKDGYKHAFSAIFDSNVTSVLTGIILIAFGTGPIQGFATTLIIGVIASFITAIFLTRIFYDYMIDKGHFKTLTFTTAISKNLFINTKINFLSKTKIFFIITGVVCVFGIISLFTFGLDKGIDFTGGRNYLVRFDKEIPTEDIRKALVAEFQGSTVTVLTSGSATASSESSQVRISTNYKHEDSSDETEAEIKVKMTTALQSYLAPGTKIDPLILSSQQVGPSVAKDLQTSSAIAVVLAVVVMALYILIRFRDVAFSVGTFVAVGLDALVVILFYSMLYQFMPFSMEINQTFIAAVLTVVGYSINDKVVIFDRIREIRNLYPKRDITEVINESLNSTLGRTVNTSLSSLVVIFCIFILGGDSIRSFSFAIFIGIAIGTYSSLFTATPIAWMMLKKKQLQNKK